MIDILQRDGKTKLRATEALLVKLIMELYKDGVSVRFLDRQIEVKGNIRSETEYWMVEILHAIVKMIKVVKVQRGVL